MLPISSISNQTAPPCFHLPCPLMLPSPLCSPAPLGAKRCPGNIEVRKRGLVRRAQASSPAPFIRRRDISPAALSRPKIDTLPPRPPKLTIYGATTPS